jgi:tetratricopeptide (TPR) repeat protein
MWVWYATIQSFAKGLPSWFYGNGFGAFKHFFPYQEATTFSDRNQDTFTAVTFRQAHNDWLQIISEVGIIGLVLFLFVVYRFFYSIQLAIRREVWKNPEGQMNGDHILLIGIGAAMAAQLMASIPDFPFHRIETALYAVVFLALVPVLTETDFFQAQLVRRRVELGKGMAYLFAFLALSGSLMAAFYDGRCWQADMFVRRADSEMKRNDQQGRNNAKSLLTSAIKLDPLPGDPYLKLSAIYEQEKDAEIALAYADKAMKNINFNARSTYHSVTYRKLHIYYHLTGELVDAYKMAEEGLELTCGRARSIYYMYGGKIALEITRYKIPEERRKEMLATAEDYLAKAMEYSSFRVQAKASLAVAKASLLKWEEAYKHASEVSAQVKDRDPTMLNIMGIAASNLGENKKAEVALKKALMLQPGNMVFNRDLAVVYLRMQKLGLARKYFENVALSPKSSAEIKAHADQMIASITAVEVHRARSLINSKKISQAKPVLEGLMNARVIATQTREWATSILIKSGMIQPEQSVISPSVEIRNNSPIYQAPQQNNEPDILQVPQKEQEPDMIQAPQTNPTQQE